MCVAPRPVHWPSPIETRDPIPAAVSPGIRTSGSLGPPSPAASIKITAAITGEPNRNEIAAKVEAVASSRPISGGPSLLHQAVGQEPKPPAERDQRGLRSDHGPQADRCKGGEDDARQVDRLRGRGVEALRGYVPPVAGQAHDREGGDGSSDGEHRERPPFGRALESELRGQVRVDALLDLVDQLQKAPRDRRRHHADDPGEHEQHGELPAPEDRLGIL